MRGGLNSYHREDQNSGQEEANNTHQVNSNLTIDTNRAPANSITPSPTRPQPQLPQLAVRYGECQKNHAANVGGHVTDGCGEFMPSGDEALKCAACDCHRSFHRREVEGSTTPYNPNPYNIYGSTSNLAQRAAVGQVFQHQLPPPLPAAPRHGYRNNVVSPVMMAFGRGVAGESSREDLNLNNENGGGQSSSKKRFRTKFTQDQKGKMREFAEKLGWKIQKQNESEVQRFCFEVGVKRQVFKVWIHNCNQASKKKQS